MNQNQVNLIPVSPIDGKPLGEFPVATKEEVDSAVRRGRGAAALWSLTSVEERVESLARLRKVLVERLDETVTAIVAATGKPDLEALTGDILTSAEFIAYYEKKSGDILAPESRPGHWLAPHSNFSVTYAPLGVVAVIAPWNYPLQLALVPLVTALAAGNAVVLKPSELTPSIGALISSLCHQAGFPAGLVQVLQGGAAVGEALVDARPDKIFFTGSVTTGKKVLARAAPHLIPVELELGGKDPLLVFADAPFERAVNGAVYGAFVNAGQACVSIERAYVEDMIYDRFVDAVTEATLRLRVGSNRQSDLGPLIRPAQGDVVERQIDDALAKGARLTTPRGRTGNHFRPVVLRDVTHEMTVMTEETFGPVLPIMRFHTEAEALELANGTVYGLNASVWTKDLIRADRVVRGLITGSCAVNDVLKNIANPHLPFGGEKSSGWGRYHGPEGLRAFSRSQSVMVNDGSRATEMNWFPYRATSYEIVKSAVLALHGGGPVLSKAAALAKQWLDAARSLWLSRGDD